jgi:pyroglutamyl-peptidase
MASQPILLTGFEPYGGRGINPSFEVVQSLDGIKISGHTVVGQTMPVTFNGLQQRIDELINIYCPAAVISLGLWPGEPMIRMERYAVNISDFEIPDNEGVFLQTTVITEHSEVALKATLPLEEITVQLLAAGIPARVSNSAGTFLCNATLFYMLKATKERDPIVPCGFMHLPYLPQQVAELILTLKKDRNLELLQRADLSSMNLSTMIRAVKVCLQTTVSQQ